ncbi:MAG: PIN domain-containing protein [Hydrogenophaga sp.]|uniref:PIN domain-containing protein n=1 Tax=Hydrogenophaga sp. TaxID=1904254 RepID=UPI0016B77F93|nr:type II toxin-antitoxin system VapC family toxin [Hydrogenophaga sp.]NIM40084.1 PIN domain-containing protein [Hydrogenophaga sp.]NIN25329.1 PIN domain-containing protein [Hydrogenophaga sp.]NIN29896.1 PIN domain-containing protein [Hydrogenophaga sp.]NIN54368.1 PIN domain-containing protein [Hydrogenophaga sp.]NIO50733.1 PIN domain-containing protein [Hydrogenophaga sp.]
MIGLDTNVIVRYIMQDDPKQAARATSLIEGLSAEAPGFIALVSVVELVWVLSSCYELSRAQVSQALEVILRSKQLVVDRAEHVVRALRAYSSGSADFADCLIERIAASAGCTQTMTFDTAAAKTAGMTLLR